MPRGVIGLVAIWLTLASPEAFAAPPRGKPLVLTDMSWVDVKDYLKKSDMVIIPLGSIEQHGPHLPLGTDWLDGMERARMLSARTGILVAPVLMVGYAEYHTGFPGTISIRPDTMEQVVFESVESLMKYGFRRFAFFNTHGGNNIVQTRLLHRINHTSEASAVAIGVGSPIHQKEEKKDDFFDWHAGFRETSEMLYLRPELVRMDRAMKPKIKLSSRVKKLMKLSEKEPGLEQAASALIGVPAETKKGGSSAELSSNGAWTFNDPKKATKEHGKKVVEEYLDSAVRFLETWRQMK